MDFKENQNTGTMDIIGGAALNSLFISGVAAALVISGAAFLGFVAFYKGNAALKQLVALASIGYAFPGTILAIGVVTIGGALDTGVANFLMKHFGISHQGWFTGGVGLVIFACVIRFQAIGYGAVTSGLERLSPNMMDAGRFRQSLTIETSVQFLQGYFYESPPVYLPGLDERYQLAQ